MIPVQDQNFLTASTQASAALIGLLFVSISIAPDRVFGGKAESFRHAQAISAFTALANVFFISFTTLIPDVQVGLVVTAIGAVAMVQTLGLLAYARRWREERVLPRSVFLFAGSAAIYGSEIWLGIGFWISPHPGIGAYSGLLEILLGAYAIGLGRAWELLGAPRGGLITRLLDYWQSRQRPPDGPTAR